jgi:hypothetical protein
MMPILRSTLRSLWNTHRPLTAVGLGSGLALVACLVGLAVDPRVVTGAPVWLKPAKFAVSIMVYCLTIAWVLGPVAASHPKLSRRAGNIIAGTLAAEFVIIAMQAARGRASHFNVATALDAALFSAMGIMIAVLWLASLAVAIAAFRTRYANPVLGEAVRWGLVISAAAAALGGFMTRPVPAQLATIRAGERPTVVGAHTVGAPDGGPGVAGLGWSTEHGDLRVAHFLGLHALQALPLFAWWLGRRPSEPRAGVALVRIAAGAWLSAVIVLAVQALRGISIFAFDAPSLVALGAVTLIAGVAAVALVGRPALSPGGNVR